MPFGTTRLCQKGRRPETWFSYKTAFESQTKEKSQEELLDKSKEKPDPTLVETRKRGRPRKIDPEPPRIQRVFWSVTEGATATALLVAGGKQGLVSYFVFVYLFILSNGDLKRHL